MPKVYLRGEREPAVVSLEDAQRIVTQKNDTKFKGMIAVGLRNVPKASIREVMFTDNGERVKRYDIDTKDGRDAVREFEKFLENLKTEFQLVHPMDYYGSPVDQEKLPGWVLNSVLGGCHWTVVHYALKNSIISRSDGEITYWAIVAQGGKDTSAYDDLKAKMDALTELRGRRQFAERKSAIPPPEPPPGFLSASQPDEPELPPLEVDENGNTDDLPF